jgi:hypothetical protein
MNTTTGALDCAVGRRCKPGPRRWHARAKLSSSRLAGYVIAIIGASGRPRILAVVPYGRAREKLPRRPLPRSCLPEANAAALNFRL